MIAFRSLLKKTFDIREGEFRRVFLMQLNIFLLISTLLILKPTITSLFLNEVGIQGLPFAFLLVAIMAGIIITFYTRILNRYPLNRIIHYTLLISVVSITVFILFLRLNHMEQWILYFFYVWVAVFGVLATSQFWILANIIFNAREAKRLFSLIGGGAIAGGIFGGYLTSILAETIGSENLLFIGAGFLLLCIPLNQRIWNSNPLTTGSVFRRRKRMGIAFERPFRLIRNSRHLTYLALITAIGVLVAKLVDYQFSAISSARILDEDELTAFFGFWFSSFSIISLLIQLFLTRRVVGVFGVGVSLFFLPAGILIGALAVLVLPGLWSAVLIKSADGSLKQSVNKSAIELLALPIPSEIKNQAKSFIDIFVDSFATGLSGIVLITMVNGLNLSVQFVSISIIALITLWFVFASRVRAEYLNLFKKRLYPDGDHQEKPELVPEIDKLSVYDGLINILENGNESQILYTLKKISSLMHQKLYSAVEKLLEHSSAEVVSEALRKLRDYPSANITKKVESFLIHPDDGVKVAAMEYIINKPGTNRHKIASSYLKHEDYKIGGAALLALAGELRDNPILKKSYNLPGIIRDRINMLTNVSDLEELLFRRLNLLGVIGLANIPDFYDQISLALGSGDEQLQRQGLMAAGNTLETDFIPVIISFLNDKRFKGAAVSALAGYGPRIIPRLREELQGKATDAGIIEAMPEIVQAVPSQEGVDFLFELMDHTSPLVRKNALDALSGIKLSHPYMVFNEKQIVNTIFDEAKLLLNTLSALYLQQEKINVPASVDPGYEKLVEARKSLIRILEMRLDENLERIFKLLGLKYPPDEISTAYRGYRSEQPELRINAIEFLDNLLEPNLKKVLLPILESPIYEALSKETIKELHIKLVNQYECFSQLLEGGDDQVLFAVLHLLKEMSDNRYLSLVEPLTMHPNLEISGLATKALKAMKE